MTYRVWIKGQKETTTDHIDAKSASFAKIAFAARNGCKSYQVEAVAA